MSAEENQLNVQGYNIVTILKRLETATSRLEDITVFQEEANERKKDGSSGGSGAIAGGAAGGAIAGGAATGATAAGAIASAPEETQEETPASVTKFNEFIADSVVPFVEASKTIDPIVGQSATCLLQAFEAQADFLTIVSKAQKPQITDPKFMEAVKPTNEKIEAIGSVKDSNRSSKFFNHLNTIAEGAPVLGWIVSDTPVSLIPEFKDSAQFWSNRIMKEYKDKDENQVEWVKKFLQIFDPLKNYVKQFHTKGPNWNNKGKPLGEVLGTKTSGSGSAPPPPPAPPGPSVAGGPPAPPPPPPADLFDDKSNEPSGMGAVFADLNKGESITSSLKKVEKSQMTHKNPELRKGTPNEGVKKPTPPKKPSSLSSSSSVPTKKPAKMELIDGSKWIVENYTKADLNGQELLTIDADMHHSIFIGNCEGIALQVKGKANAISVSNTKSVAMIVDSLISGVELIKSNKFGLQVLGTVVDISTDQCDEGTIYLSQESVDNDTQIYTSSTNALNINVLKDGDFVELPAPEQFKHSIKNGKLVSEVVEHMA